MVSRAVEERRSLDAIFEALGKDSKNAKRQAVGLSRTGLDSFYAGNARPATIEKVRAFIKRNKGLLNGKVPITVSSYSGLKLSSEDMRRMAELELDHEFLDDLADLSDKLGVPFTLDHIEFLIEIMGNYEFA